MTAKLGTNEAGAAIRWVSSRSLDTKGLVMSTTMEPNERLSNRGGPGAGRIIAIVLGSTIALAGVGALVGAGALGWANATQRDAQGYFSTSTDRFTTSTHAITSDRIDLSSGAGPGEWFSDNDNLATVRIRARTAGNVFVGIGSQADVERYLAGVAHDEVTDVDYRPFRVQYRRSPGTAPPTDPTVESFWVADASGEGTQTLTWAPTGGDWMVVVMNADGAPVVTADVALGVRVTFLGWIVGALSIGGGIAVLIGAALIVAGAATSRRSPDDTGPSAVAAVPSTSGVTQVDGSALRSSPVRLEGQRPGPLNRWLWLVKWVLLIPHAIVLAFLWVAFVVVTFVAGVAIVFTGRYPRSLFDFNVGVMRWTWRAQFYGPSAYGTDTYPPFALGRTPYPATLEIEYPERLSRGLVFVKSWLLAIPHLVIIAIFTSGWSWNRNSGGGAWRATQFGMPGGLIGICAAIAGIVLLIRRTYPVGLFDFILGMNRWVYRVVAYVALMTDEYPPFHFDGGPTEPTAPSPQPSGSLAGANATDDREPALAGSTS